MTIHQAADWDRVESGKASVETWLKKPGILNQAGRAIADRVVPQWSVPREWLAAYHESQRKAAFGREKAMDVIRALAQGKGVGIGLSGGVCGEPGMAHEALRRYGGSPADGIAPGSLAKVGGAPAGPAARNGHGARAPGVLSLDTLEELTSSGWMPRFTGGRSRGRRWIGWRG